MIRYIAISADITSPEGPTHYRCCSKGKLYFSAYLSPMSKLLGEHITTDADHYLPQDLLVLVCSKAYEFLKKEADKTSYDNVLCSSVSLRGASITQIQAGKISLGQFHFPRQAILKHAIMDMHFDAAVMMCSMINQYHLLPETSLLNVEQISLNNPTTVNRFHLKQFVDCCPSLHTLTFIQSYSTLVFTSDACDLFNSLDFPIKSLSLQPFSFPAPEVAKLQSIVHLDLYGHALIQASVEALVLLPKLKTLKAGRILLSSAVLKEGQKCSWEEVFIKQLCDFKTYFHLGSVLETISVQFMKCDSGWDLSDISEDDLPSLVSAVDLCMRKVNNPIPWKIIPPCCLLSTLPGLKEALSPIFYDMPLGNFSTHESIRNGDWQQMLAQVPLLVFLSSSSDFEHAVQIQAVRALWCVMTHCDGEVKGIAKRGVMPHLIRLVSLDAYGTNDTAVSLQKLVLDNGLGVPITSGNDLWPLSNWGYQLWKETSPARCSAVLGPLLFYLLRRENRVTFKGMRYTYPPGSAGAGHTNSAVEHIEGIQYHPDLTAHASQSYIDGLALSRSYAKQIVKILQFS